MLRYSPSSGEWSEPPPWCARSRRRATWNGAPPPGVGELVSWTVRPGRRGEDGRRAPDQVIGIVETAEGPWLTLRLVDAAGRGLAVGMAVRVDFVRPEGGEAMPVGRVSG
ncbi:OB-fold domain-containing protein [Actinomadura madurae]|uniref:Zn-ribbon domain-containing OB-fold protein n=1 Tax=Actinomadura madurae TaxID=1993 RepID=UPI0020D24315|nr:OB-fold domain-containing protein [Actinomadura madurae]MCP9948203.1 OB-fold domain-containing protein [Actinomadura madurae]